jgi:RimJ/RimL family protein N-acetyltransferase
MNTELLSGEKIHLVALEPEKMAELFNRWAGDTEYWRLANSDPVIPFSAESIKTWLEEHSFDKDNFFFAINRLQDNRPIGDINLSGIDWIHRNAYLGISIGEREEWSKGYGTDAVRVILRFAFKELNLHRVSLTVFDYNQRAKRAYEKAGFRTEGRQRGFLKREGQRWDLIYMGILRREWDMAQTTPQLSSLNEIGEINGRRPELPGSHF